MDERNHLEKKTSSTIGTRILTDNFYKFLFGFIGVVFVSLVIIAIAGVIGSKSKVEPADNIAGDCVEGSAEC